MPSRKTPEIADELDHMLFNAANRLERLAEITGDSTLSRASKIVGSQRPYVRAHMTEQKRNLTQN